MSTGATCPFRNCRAGTAAVITLQCAQLLQAQPLPLPLNFGLSLFSDFKTVENQSEHFVAAGIGTFLQSSAQIFPILGTWPFKGDSLLATGCFHSVINGGYGSIVVWMMLQLQMWEIESRHMLLSMEQLSRLPAKCH